MLPTSGYFRDLVCPFLKMGICERAYCHFLHERNVIKHTFSFVKHQTNKKTSSQPIYVPTPINILKSETVSTANNKSTLLSTKSITDIPTYQPTPIIELKKRQVYSEIEETVKKKGKTKVTLETKATKEKIKECKTETAKTKITRQTSEEKANKTSSKNKKDLSEDKKFENKNAKIEKKEKESDTSLNAKVEEAYESVVPAKLRKAHDSSKFNKPVIAI